MLLLIQRKIRKNLPWAWVHALFRAHFGMATVFLILLDSTVMQYSLLFWWTTGLYQKIWLYVKLWSMFWNRRSSCLEVPFKVGKQKLGFSFFFFFLALHMKTHTQKSLRVWRWLSVLLSLWIMREEAATGWLCGLGFSPCFGQACYFWSCSRAPLFFIALYGGKE